MPIDNSGLQKNKDYDEEILEILTKSSSAISTLQLSLLLNLPLKEICERTFKLRKSGYIRVVTRKNFTYFTIKTLKEISPINFLGRPKRLR